MDNSQIESTIGQIRKRNGSIVTFNKDKIANAIYKALSATSKADSNLADQLAEGVIKKLTQQGFSASRPPSVEDIQDMVESTLIELGHSDIAKSYILYRHERRKVRDEKMKVLNAKSLDIVSKNFDLNFTKLAEINGLENPDLIFPGNQLIIKIQSDHTILVVDKEEQGLLSKLAEVLDKYLE